MNDDVKEVSPGIFMIEERGLSRVYKPPVNVYVITGTDGLVFDAGYGNSGAIRQFEHAYKSIIRHCESGGVNAGVSRILISHAHPDHFAGLRKLSAMYNLKIMVTGRMSEILRSGRAYRDSFAYKEPGRKERSVLCGGIKRVLDRINYRLYAWSWGIDFISRPDIVISDTCSVTVNGREWQIFHSPGHSDDHITLYNPETGILLGGDNILRSKFTWLGPPRSDIDLYLESLRFIMKLPGLTMILPAHGSVITAPVKRISEIISYWENRMKQVRGCVHGAGASGITLIEILRQLYPGSGRVKHEFARGWVLLVLEKFMKDGVIYIKGTRFFSVMV